MTISPMVQAMIEEWLGLAMFFGVFVVLAGLWLVMTFMWPQTRAQWAVWAKTTAFLSIVSARLVLIIMGEPRFPWPVGAIINGVALLLLLYFAKAYFWDTWIVGKNKQGGGARGTHQNHHPQ